MIIYSLTINRGGLLRVTESMFRLFDYLEKDFPLRIVYFNHHPVPGLDPEKFIFQRWDEGNPDQLTDAGIKQMSQELKQKLAPFNVQRIIYESSISRYWKEFETKFSIDVHLLERPLYAMMRENPKLSLINEVSPDPIVTLLTNLGLVGLKLETNAFRRADHFISNSHTTTRDLQKFYGDEIKGKRIHHVPVTTHLEAPVGFEPLKEGYDVAPSFLYFGRFHPQKGLHFLFGRDWEGAGLTIKGFDDKLVLTEKFLNLKKRNINFENWTFSGSAVAESLGRHHFVVFPSLYEPFGLALTEALSLGKICIAHDNDSGHNEQIRHGVNGFLVNMNDEAALSKLITDLRKMSKTELLKISQAAKDSVTLKHEDRLKSFAQMLKDIVE